MYVHYMCAWYPESGEGIIFPGILFMLQMVVSHYIGVMTWVVRAEVL